MRRQCIAQLQFWHCTNLDGYVRAEVEIELVGMSAARFHKSTWERVFVSVTPIWEEANVMTLACCKRLAVVSQGGIVAWVAYLQ
jgi:hypothetical protein